MNELYKINNDINNIKKEIIKTLKKEDGIRFQLFKESLNKNSFPYYESKYEEFLINGKNDDIEDDKIWSIANYMNIEENMDYYYILSSHLEIYNNNYDKIFEIRHMRRELEVKYDKMVNMKNELEIIIDNYNAKKEIIKNIIKIIIIYLMIIFIFIYLYK